MHIVSSDWNVYYYTTNYQIQIVLNIDPVVVILFWKKM